MWPLCALIVNVTPDQHPTVKFGAARTTLTEMSQIVELSIDTIYNQEDV